jgi:hypothetical protein
MDEVPLFFTAASAARISASARRGAMPKHLLVKMPDLAHLVFTANSWRGGPWRHKKVVPMHRPAFLRRFLT